MAAAASAVIDNLLFLGAMSYGLSLVASHAAARCLALGLNYVLLRRFVFFSHQAHRLVLPKFLAVVAIWWTASLVMIRFLASTGDLSTLESKLIVECLLFPLSFLVQREWVFGARVDPL